MKNLNIGCGSIYRQGYINIDAFDNNICDIISKATSLPFKDETFEKVESYHLIEHLNYIEAIYAISECFRVIKPSGKLVIETPDIEGSFKKFLSSTKIKERSSLLTWIFGFDSPGQNHKLLYPQKLLKLILKDAGFRNIRFESPKTHLYREGIRVVAFKNNKALYKLIANFRTKIFYSNFIDFKDYFLGFEFETLFINKIKKIDKSLESYSNLIYESLIYSPYTTLKWFEVLKENNLYPYSYKFIDLANILIKLSFPSRMMNKFFDYIEEDKKIDNLYQHIFSIAKSLLIKIEKFPIKDQLIALKEEFPKLDKNTYYLFSPYIITNEIRKIRDKGIKKFVLKDYESSGKLLKMVINSGIEPFYAILNYAILNGILGNFKEAKMLYKTALTYNIGSYLRKIIKEEIKKLDKEKKSILRNKPILLGEGIYHYFD